MEPKEPEQTQQKITSQDSKKTQPSLASICTQNLLRMATLYGREVNPMWLGIWTEALSAVSPVAAEAAFSKLLRTFEPTAACPFPTPAHLLKLVEKVEEASREEKALETWRKSLQMIETHYHPDIGYRGPVIPERIKRALGAAGGMHYVSQCPESDLQWASKRFVESMLRQDVVEMDHAMLAPGSDAKQLMEGFAAVKSLPESDVSLDELRERLDKMKAELAKKLASGQ